MVMKIREHEGKSLLFGPVLNSHVNVHVVGNHNGIEQTLSREQKEENI